METRRAFSPLTWPERAFLCLFGAVMIVFGGVVEVRCTRLHNPHTDLGAYLRAGWAVRAGVDPYTVTDDNDWHFAYPPVVAILFVPLADAPAGVARSWMLPFAVSVAVWYVFNVCCILLAVHWIAATLEETSPDPAVRTLPWGCRRWWYVRVLPLLLCLIQIGNTLSRGQVSLILILLLAGMFRATMKRRRLTAGLCLAAAICLKLIPAFLLLVPLWRREGRTLLGVALGLLVGIVVLPVLVWGTPGALVRSGEMVNAVIMPALADRGDQARAEELTGINATDHQSIVAILHNYQHWHHLEKRPPQPAAWARLTHWILGAVLVVSTLFAFGWTGDDSALRLLLLLGALFLVMVLVSPLSHLHYFAMAVPLIMGLMGASLASRGTAAAPSWPVLALLILAGVGFALPTLPFWEARREAGVPLITSLFLWLMAIVYLCKTRRSASPPSRWQRVPSASTSISDHSVSLPRDLVVASRQP